MKTLLSALKTRLVDQAVVAGEKAVHLMPAEDALPTTTPFPCVGLKDGDIDNKYVVGASEHFLSVDVFAYVLIHGYDGIIIGKGSQKGVLDLMDDVKAALIDYEPAGYRALHDDVPETGSAYMQQGEDKLVQKKKITLKWFKKATT